MASPYSVPRRALIEDRRMRMRNAEANANANASAAGDSRYFDAYNLRRPKHDRLKSRLASRLEFSSCLVCW